MIHQTIANIPATHQSRSKMVPPEPDVLAALTSLWCMQQALILLFSFAKGFLTTFEALQVVLLLAAAVCAQSTRRWVYAPSLALALCARIAANTAIFPMMWESHLWCAETDCAMLFGVVSALLAKRDNKASALAAKNELADRIAITVRWQMALFYMGAAFWKLNTSFLDHRYSCAPLFFASIMAAYLPPSIATPSVTAAVLRAAPCIIVGGELALASALLVAAWGRCEGKE